MGVMSRLKGLVRRGGVENEGFRPVRIFFNQSPMTSWEGTQEIELTNRVLPDTQGLHKAKVPTWYVQHPYGRPRIDDIVTLRALANMGIVQRCINVILDQVMNMKWVVEPSNPFDESPETMEKIEEMTRFLQRCNSNEFSLAHEVRKALTDYFEIGEGVLVKMYDPSAYVMVDGHAIVPEDVPSGMLREVKAYDASQFYLFQDLHGRNLGHWQFNHIGTPPQFFSPREIILFIDQPATYQTYGRSRVKQIQDMLEQVLSQIVQTKRYYQSGAIFQGILESRGLNKNDQKRLDNWLKNQFSKQRHKFGVFHNNPGGELNFIPLMVDVKDIAFLEGFDFVQKFVMSMYGVMPFELGYPEGLNRSSAEEQSMVMRRRTINTIINMLEYRFNTEIWPEMDPKGLTKFTIVPDTDILVEKVRNQISISQVDRSMISINEWRKQNKLPPVTWGDIPLPVMKLQLEAAVAEANLRAREDRAPLGPEGRESPPVQGDAISRRRLASGKVRQTRVSTNENVERYATREYDMPLPRAMKGMMDKGMDDAIEIGTLVMKMKQVISSWIDSMLEEESPHEMLGKTEQPDRMRTELEKLLDAALDRQYRKGLEKYGGKSSWTDEYIAGFPLIIADKLAVDVANDLRQEIMDAIIKGEGIPAIKKRVKEVLGTVGYKAERVARTETLNAYNYGIYNSLRDRGFRKWRFITAASDSCDICKGLDGQVFDIDDTEFRPPKGTHPNCRCTISGAGDTDPEWEIGSITPKMAKVEIMTGRSIPEILKMHSGKGSRTLANELGGEVSYKTIANWRKQFSRRLHT